MPEPAERSPSPSLPSARGVESDAVTGVKRQRVEDGRSSPHAMLDVITITPITGTALPMPLSSLHSTGASSLPASLPSSALPLPFPPASASLSSSSSALTSSASPSLPSASPSSSSSIDSPPRPSAALVSLVDQFAYKVHLPPPQARLALQLVSSLVAFSPHCPSPLHASTSDNQQSWAACCIWLSVLLSSLPSSVSAAVTFAPPQLVSPTLTELLILLSLPLSDFLRHAVHALSHVTPLLLPNEAAVVSERCGVWMQRWLYSCALWRKYEKMYATLIYHHMTNVERTHTAAEPGAAVGGWRSADLYGCGWLLFQSVKGELHLSEAHPTYVVLLCVLRLMLCCVKRESEDERAKEAAEVDVLAASEEAMESALREVCHHDGAVDEQLLAAVRAMHTSDLQPVLSRLQDHGMIRFPSPAQQYALFGPMCLQANITSLGHLLDSRPQMEEAVPACFVLDERVFLMDRLTEADSGGGAAQQPQQQQADVASEAEVKMNGKRSAPSHRRTLFTAAESNGAMSTSPTPAASPSSSPSPLSTTSSRSANSPFSSASLPFSTPHKLTTPHHAFSPSLRPPHLPSTSHLGTRSPITRMLESVSFLHTTFSSLPPTPSPALHTYFASKQAGGLEALQKLISGVVGKVRISDSGGGGTSGGSEGKRELGVKIYWSVIDSLVASSSSSHTAASTPSWLLSRTFHCALLCVCFELVFSAYKHTLLAFPHSLHVFGDIKYWDLLKVVDTALRHLPPLPAALKAHVGGMEVSMCERRCWMHGERAVEMMADERIRAKVEETMRTAINNQSIASSQADRQPSADERKEDILASASSNTIRAHSTSPPLPTSAAFRADLSALLSLCRKLLSLCADRLSYMSTDLALSLSPLQQQATWTLLLHCLLCHPSLLFGRHVDSLLLCCLYTVKVKVCNSDCDFKRIILVYVDRWDREMTEVVREVDGKPTDASDGSKGSGSGGGGGRKVQIIQFYNEVFIPTVQEFILHTLKPAVVIPPSSSSVASSTSRPPLSPLPVRSRGGVDGGDGYPTIFISTMRAGIPPGPQQRVLSAVVGESPTKRLQEMNEMLVSSSRKGVAAVARGRAGGMAGSKQLFRRGEDGKSEVAGGIELGGGGIEGVVGAADGVAALLLASGSTAGSNGHTLR